VRSSLAVLVLAAWVLVAARGRAQQSPAEAGALRLDDVLASVDRSFPLLKAAELESSVARAEVLSAEGGFDVSWKTRGVVTPIGYYDSLRIESMVEQPTAIWGASAFAGFKLGRGNFAVYDGAKETLEYGELRAGMNVPLWRNGPVDRRRATLATAELGREIAGLSVAEQRIRYRRAAAHGYWAWVAAGRRLGIAQELLQNVQDRDAGLGARIDSGDLPSIERTDNARAIEQRKAQAALAGRGLEQAAIELGLFLRDPNGRPAAPPPSRLPPAFPEPPAELATTSASDSALAQAQRPEARQLTAQVRQNEIELRYAKNQLAPGIDIQVAGSQDFGQSLARRPDLKQPILELTLLLDIPIQTRLMRGKADAAAAKATLLGSKRTYATDRIDADVRSAHAALRAARTRIESTRREVSLARVLASAERVRFDHGDSQLLLVNIREQQTAEAELREADALLDYYRAVADLKAARGE
jgi:outer membrane protein, heavy metal efflux system